MGESAITLIHTGDNLSDLMTKVTPGAKRLKLVGGILYDIYYDHPTQRWYKTSLSRPPDLERTEEIHPCVVNFD